jgi:protein TonB
VHGQLKPANIMAIGDQLKISSDSVGKEGSGALYPSLHGAPEAANGALSPAADIWSFGMTMVEALTQQLPSGKSGADGDLELPALPAPFLEIAQHCLTPGPGRRWTIAGIRAHLSPKQIQAPHQVQAEQPEEPAQLAITALLAKMAQDSPRAQSKAPQPQPFLVEEEVNARSLLEICKPYVPVTLAAGLLLAITGTVLTMGPAKSPQGRDTASLSSASPAAASSMATSPAASVSAGEHAAQTPGATSVSGTAGTSSPAVQDSASKAPQQAPQAVPRPESMSASLANASVSGTLVPGTVIERPLPSVPLKARRTIHGRVKIKVKVAVDPSGSVARATLDSRASSNYFAGIAMDTARRWRFSPAQINGQNVASEWILKFEFGRSRTKISPFAIVAADQHL